MWASANTRLHPTAESLSIENEGLLAAGEAERYVVEIQKF